MTRLQQTQRKRVESVPRLPVDVVAAIAAETIVLEGLDSIRFHLTAATQLRRPLPSTSSQSSSPARNRATAGERGNDEGKIGVKIGVDDEGETRVEIEGNNEDQIGAEIGGDPKDHDKVHMEEKNDRIQFVEQGLYNIDSEKILKDAFENILADFSSGGVQEGGLYESGQFISDDFSPNIMEKIESVINK
ncbi:hypothetical protein AgCh_020282 [Apium graveolens]